MAIDPSKLTLYLITDPHLCARFGVEQTVDAAVKGGATMVQLRDKLNSDAKAAEILEQGHSLHTLPGSVEKQAASWETNECVGTDRRGDVVVFERFGAVNVAKLLAEFPADAFKQWNTYRYEARAMMLDLLARRARRVVEFSLVVDLNGIGLAFMNLTRRYMPEYLSV